MTPLTEKQTSVLEFMKSFLIENHRTPTSREIQDHFGFKSQTSAVANLVALESKGFIQKEPKKNGYKITNCKIELVEFEAEDPTEDKLFIAAMQ